jgi:hypothetical protein
MIKSTRCGNRKSTMFNWKNKMYVGETVGSVRGRFSRMKRRRLIIALWIPI